MTHANATASQVKSTMFHGRTLQVLTL